MKIQDIDEKACWYLAEANAAFERGDKERAEKLYEKADSWLKKLNDALGNGDD